MRIHMCVGAHVWLHVCRSTCMCVYVCLCAFPVLKSNSQLVFVLLGDLNAASTKSKVTSVGE